eukprot:CAMPEP_0171736744 /NCGR_PEP_ID=MMETSP0991-20121206/32460_1 /TAXON_ID=483369 /ORGANISM="non described non described, Strain CCMP2098" /LENGTH=191 /DNA_ID=CAMNT_0012333509 /DNA_START=196 /DNA_END=772 /DNA_ORIENTATION=-
MATALLLAGRFADKAADLVAATTKAMAEMMVDATKAILELGKEPRREWELWWKRRDFYEKAHLREAKETVVMTISGAAGTSQAGATGVGNAAAVFAMVETATKAAEAVGKLLLQPKLSKPQLSPPHDSSGGRTAAAVMLAAAARFFFSFFFFFFFFFCFIFLPRAVFAALVSSAAVVVFSAHGLCRGRCSD